MRFTCCSFSGRLLPLASNNCAASSGVTVTLVRLLLGPRIDELLQPCVSGENLAADVLSPLRVSFDDVHHVRRGWQTGESIKCIAKRGPYLSLELPLLVRGWPAGRLSRHGLALLRSGSLANSRYDGGN